MFKERVLAAVAGSPSSVRWFVVAAEPVTSVDVTAADVLAELDETLRADPTVEAAVRSYVRKHPAKQRG